MNLQAVALHTIDIARLPLTNVCVLDVGCRGFRFSEAIQEWAQAYVHALDPSPDMSDPQEAYITYHRLGLVGLNQGGVRSLAQGADPEAWHLVDTNTPQHPSESTSSIQAEDIVTFSAIVGVPFWDVVKLNCEGAEYHILGTWPGPIADQICVSFHEHTGAHQGQSYDHILSHLGQWYDVVQHERDERYCAGPNYWDSLFVLR